VIQIVAFIPYAIGSWRFYTHKSRFLFSIGLGIALDALMALSASFGWLPRMQSDQGAPWDSVLFVTHVATTVFGMFGFLFLFVYVLVRGTTKEYPKLRAFQYKVMFRLWCLGVAIALANFIVKVAFGIRIYDYV